MSLEKFYFHKTRGKSACVVRWFQIVLENTFIFNNFWRLTSVCWNNTLSWILHKVTLNFRKILKTSCIRNGSKRIKHSVLWLPSSLKWKILIVMKQIAGLVINSFTGSRILTCCTFWLLSSSLSSRAICHLKLNCFSEAKQDCDSALQLDPSNKKAFYRRALAYKGLQVPVALNYKIHHFVFLEMLIRRVCEVT